MTYTNYTTIGPDDYRERRYNIIKYVEESGEVKLNIYDDSKGLATIGVGMNIEVDSDMRKAIIAHFLKDNGNLATNLIRIMDGGEPAPTMQTKLNAEMARLADANSSLGLRRTFTFLDEDEVKKVFNKGAAGYETKLSEWVRDLSLSAPYTGDEPAYMIEERLPLFSMYYNLPKLIVDSGKMRTAIDENERAEAWYEIRYQSNGWKFDPKKPEPDPRNGVAKRRYYESELFKLYKDRDNVTKDEAEDVAQMYAKHRTIIVDYDEKRDHMIDDANRDYAQVLYGHTVRNRADSFAPAKEKLNKDFELKVSNVDDYEFLMADSEKDTKHIKLDVSVTPTEDKSVILGDDASNILNIGSREGILAGGKGTDALEQYGSTSWAQLYGGSGNDSLVGDGATDHFGIFGLGIVKGGAEKIDRVYVNNLQVTGGETPFIYDMPRAWKHISAAFMTV